MKAKQRWDMKQGETRETLITCKPAKHFVE